MAVGNEVQQHAKRRTKIVYYNHTGQVSGAERVLLATLAQLPKEQFSTLLLCPEDGPLQTEALALGTDCLAVRRLNARITKNPLRLLLYVFSILRTMAALRRSFASSAPDLIHANTVRAGIVATLATVGTKIPILWHVHDVLPSHPITSIIRALVRYSGRTSLVTCSRAAAESIVDPKTIGTPKATVVHNGIEVNRFRSNASEREAIRAELGLTAENFVIGIVGQIAPRKGHLNLVRAFAAVKAAIPRARLVIVGAPLFNRDHEYLARVRSELQQLRLEREVYFLGQRNDVPAVMQAFDVVSLSSTVEPFGLVIPEAMALSKPVIATRSGGPEEIIEHGITGYLVPVNDSKAMAAGLLELATNRDLYQRLADEARAHVLRNFSSCLYMRNLEHVYSGFKPKANTPVLGVQLNIPSDSRVSS